jgi:hypothetical protein
MEIDLETVITLMQEVEREDPIDWADLRIDESAATRVIVSSMIDQYRNSWQSLPESDRALAILATMSKLVLENFVLNVRLRQREI